jgi:hypothetical protein
MKHASTRQLFEYWNERRGRRPAPDRGEIEPGAIRRVLADTFILAFDKAAGHPFRIAGTRVCATFGRELKNEAFVGLWTPESTSLIRDLIAVVATESVGVVASVEGIDGEGALLELELIVLPLCHGGRTDARMLGALVPTVAHHWIGTSTLGSLKLGTLRYVGGDLEPGPHLIPAEPRGRIRHGLVVYDGGQA